MLSLNLTFLKKEPLLIALGLFLFLQKSAFADIAAPWDHQQWHKLLHYRSDWFSSGLTSRIKSTAFFLAGDQGKHDSRAEFLATVERFKAPATDTSVNEQHPQCAFPARYLWIKTHAPRFLSSVPEVDCPRLNEWLRNVGGERFSLIFASSYLNNPASMFGHTFLRIDRKVANPLLQYGVGFSAVVNDPDFVLYPIKGLLGFYPGIFTIQPYAELVDTYGNLESRDLWEYEINLDEPQRRLLVRHLWELGGAWSKYYFLDDNCSYYLLALLEAANPELSLTRRFPGWVIPAETLKVITKRYPSLLEPPVYRPSLETILNKSINTLTESDLAAFDIFKQKKSITPNSSADALDTMILLQKYRAALQGSLPLIKDPIYVQLLQKRAARTTTDLVRAEEASKMVPPHQSHDATRLSLTAGWFGQTRSVVSLGIKGAFHEHLDPSAGQLPFAQINVLDFQGGIQHERSKRSRFYFKQLTLLEIDSVSPWRRYHNPLSWSFATGVKRLSAEAWHKPRAYIEGGVGYSTPEIWGRSVMTGSLRARVLTSKSVVEPGVRAQFLVATSNHLPALRLDSNLWISNLPTRKPQALLESSVALRSHFQPNHAIEIAGHHGLNLRSRHSHELVEVAAHLFF